VRFDDDVDDDDDFPFLWPRYLPLGFFVTVDGPDGVGKTRAVLDIAARVTTGSRWPDGSPGCDPADVLYLTHDLPEKAIRRIVKATGTSLDRFEWMDEPMQFPDDLVKIDTYVRANTATKLAIIDPWSKYVTTAHGEEAAHRLQDLADALQICIVAIRHTIKSARSALDAGQGSHQIRGAARAAYLVWDSPRRADEILLVPHKSTLGPEPPTLGWVRNETDDPTIHWLERPSDVVIGDLFADSSRSYIRRDCAEFLREQLESGPLPVSIITASAKEAGFKDATITKARTDLGIHGKAHQGGPVRIGGAAWRGAWYWRLQYSPPSLQRYPTQEDLDFMLADFYRRNPWFAPHVSDDVDGLPGWLVPRSDDPKESARDKGRKLWALATCDEASPEAASAREKLSELRDKHHLDDGDALVA
jgi:hypothetical protein